MGGGAGGAGGATAGPGQFVQDLYKGVLPINELANSVGLKLPSFLGTSVPDAPKPADNTGANKPNADSSKGAKIAE